MTIKFDETGWGQCMKEGHTGEGLYTVKCPECAQENGTITCEKRLESNVITYKQIDYLVEVLRDTGKYTSSQIAIIAGIIIDNRVVMQSNHLEDVRQINSMPYFA